MEGPRAVLRRSRSVAPCSEERGGWEGGRGARTRSGRSGGSRSTLPVVREGLVEVELWHRIGERGIEGRRLIERELDLRRGAGGGEGRGPLGDPDVALPPADYQTAIGRGLGCDRSRRSLVTRGQPCSVAVA